MFNPRRILLATLVATAVAGGALLPAARAEPGPDAPKPGAEMGEKILHRLELMEERIARIEKMQKQERGRDREEARGEWRGREEGPDRNREGPPMRERAMRRDGDRGPDRERAGRDGPGRGPFGPAAGAMGRGFGLMRLMAAARRGDPRAREHLEHLRRMIDEALGGAPGGPPGAGARRGPGGPGDRDRGPGPRRGPGPEGGPEARRAPDGARDREADGGMRGPAPDGLPGRGDMKQRAERVRARVHELEMALVEARRAERPDAVGSYEQALDRHRQAMKLIEEAQVLRDAAEEAGKAGYERLAANHVALLRERLQEIERLLRAPGPGKPDAAERRDAGKGGEREEKIEKLRARIQEMQRELRALQEAARSQP
jgi:hypothetical protein